MPIDRAIIEVGPVDPAWADLLEVEHTRNCMGQDVFIYYLAEALGTVLLAQLHTWGDVQYPLGKACGVAKLESSGNFLLSGIVGGRELRITLRNAAPEGLRAAFEADLVRAIQYRASSG